MGVSAIAATAAALNLSCSVLFAEAANARFHVDDQQKLKDFATSACSTTSPDAFFAIAAVESGFRFDIARVNYRGAYEVLLAQDVSIATSLLAEYPKANVDLGVMQVNWKFHRGAFELDPQKMLSPSAQVEFVTGSFGQELRSACGEKWIECYHNRRSKKIRKSYSKKISRALTKLNHFLRIKLEAL